LACHGRWRHIGHRARSATFASFAVAFRTAWAAAAVAPALFGGELLDGHLPVDVVAAFGAAFLLPDLVRPVANAVLVGLLHGFSPIARWGHSEI